MEQLKEKDASKKTKIEIEVDTTQLDEAIKKAKELSKILEKVTTKENEMQMAIDCMAQHLKAFFEQSVKQEQSDFGEPCTKCRYFNSECHYEWLDVMDPLLKKSNVSISVRHQDILGKESSDHTHLSSLEDTHLNNNTHKKNV